MMGTGRRKSFSVFKRKSTESPSKYNQKMEQEIYLRRKNHVDYRKIKKSLFLEFAFSNPKRVAMSLRDE